MIKSWRFIKSQDNDESCLEITFGIVCLLFPLHQSIAKTSKIGNKIPKKSYAQSANALANAHDSSSPSLFGVDCIYICSHLTSSRQAIWISWFGVQIVSSVPTCRVREIRYHQIIIFGLMQCTEVVICQYNVAFWIFGSRKLCDLIVN